MALKVRLPTGLKGPFVWRAGLTVSLLLCASLTGWIWLSGMYETRDAVKEGRRLMVKLEDGLIEGNKIFLDKLDRKTESPAESSPATESKPESESASPVAESSPASPSSPVESAAASPEPSTSPSSLESPPQETASSPSPAETTPMPSAETLPPTPAPPLPPHSALAEPSATPLAPIKAELLEKSDTGMLPIVSADGKKPWRVYSKFYERKGAMPIIAVIVTGLGQNKNASEAALRLPEQFSLSFSPYAKDVTTWVNSARASGHEVLLDLPLEPSNYPASDPGPHGLLLGKGPTENAERLKWVMSRVQGYVGFVTPQNEVYSSDLEAFNTLQQALDARGLMLVLGHEPAKTETTESLDKSSLPHNTADVLIDEELSIPAIQARLATLEKIAGKRGMAIGVAQPFPISMKELTLWSQELEKRGFLLVPITFITKLKYAS